MKRLPIVILVAALLVSIPYMYGMNANESYTISVYKVNSDATRTLVDSVVAVADANGKYTFSFNSIPTNDEANFIVFETKDQAGMVVSRSFVPAPPANGTNELGINDLSTSQTNCIIAAGDVCQTDNPIMVAYLLVMVRSDAFTEAAAQTMAQVGKEVLLGSDGFVGYLQANGVSSTQLTTFKSKLIYNNATGSKDLRSFTSKFKAAVDSGNVDSMYEAGGYMAEIFVDAAMASGIDPALILGAHNQAGEVIQATPALQALFSGLPASIQNSVNQSMSAFGTKIATGKIIREYTNALQTLNASGEQVAQFQNAATAFSAASQAIDREFGMFFNNPQGFVDESPEYGTIAEVRAALEQRFTTAFSTMQTAIAASDATITAMRTKITTAFPGVPLFNDFGKVRNFENQQTNWPVPMVVIWNWIADIYTNGGSLTYNRAAVEAAMPVPSNMNWLNGTGQRSTYTQGGQANGFSIMCQVMEDVNIADFTRNAVYQSGPPTPAQEKAARAAFAANLKTIIAALSGTKDAAGSAVSAAEADAMIRLLMQPNIHG